MEFRHGSSPLSWPREALQLLQQHGTFLPLPLSIWPWFLSSVLLSSGTTKSSSWQVTYHEAVGLSAHPQTFGLSNKVEIGPLIAFWVTDEGTEAETWTWLVSDRAGIWSQVLHTSNLSLLQVSQLKIFPPLFLTFQKWDGWKDQVLPTGFVGGFWRMQRLQASWGPGNVQSAILPAERCSEKL